ncbi:MAG: ATP-dependent Clp protease adaptor ClpS [Ardenticatenales bacterium]|nr:ATP-dependent Clp protease adaptor ClpS [Ardenticatenales bacterium]
MGGIGIPRLQEVEAPSKPIIDFEVLPVSEEDLEKLYRVIIINDDVTTFEFVIVSLIVVFGLDQARAEAIAWETHTKGEAYVATMPLQEAKDKVFRVQYAARQQGYPLEFVIEPEE